MCAAFCVACTFSCHAESLVSHARQVHVVIHEYKRLRLSIASFQSPPYALQKHASGVLLERCWSIVPNVDLAAYQRMPGGKTNPWIAHLPNTGTDACTAGHSGCDVPVKLDVGHCSNSPGGAPGLSIGQSLDFSLDNLVISLDVLVIHM